MFSSNFLSRYGYQSRTLKTSFSKIKNSSRSVNEGFFRTFYSNNNNNNNNHGFKTALVPPPKTENNDFIDKLFNPDNKIPKLKTNESKIHVPFYDDLLYWTVQNTQKQNNLTVYYDQIKKIKSTSTISNYSLVDVINDIQALANDYYEKNELEGAEILMNEIVSCVNSHSSRTKEEINLLQRAWGNLIIINRQKSRQNDSQLIACYKKLLSLEEELYVIETEQQEKFSDKRLVRMLKLIKNISLLHESNDFHSLLPLEEKALEIKKKFKTSNEKEILKSLHSLALINFNLSGKMSQAIKYYKLILIMMKTFPDDKLTIHVLDQLGFIYLKQENHIKAKITFKKALRIKKQLEKYHTNDELDKHLYFQMIRSTTKTHVKIDHFLITSWITTNLKVLGNIYTKCGQKERAKYYTDLEDLYKTKLEILKTK